MRRGLVYLTVAINYVLKQRKALKSQGLNRSSAENKEVTKREVFFTVIPASEARQESF